MLGSRVRAPKGALKRRSEMVSVFCIYLWLRRFFNVFDSLLVVKLGEIRYIEELRKYPVPQSLL